MEREHLPVGDSPEAEPVSSSESLGDQERERPEPSYTRDQLLEAMVVAKWPGAEASKRTDLVESARGLLDGYKLGLEPDFHYLTEALEFIWNEVTVPEMLGKPHEELVRRKAELAESYAQREAEFVKQAYQRFLERKGRPTG